MSWNSFFYKKKKTQKIKKELTKIEIPVAL